MKAHKLVTFSFAVLLVLSTLGCAQVKTPSAKPSNTGMFQNADFEITLESNWKRRDGDDIFEWEDDGQLQEITISVLVAKDPMSPEIMISSAKKLMDIREKAIQEISNGNVRFNFRDSIIKNDSVEMVVRGVDQVNEMQVYTVMIVHPTRIVTLGYYKYPPLLNDEEFRKRTGDIRSALKVR